MNFMIKGIVLGLSVNTASVLCNFLSYGFSYDSIYLISALVIGIVITLFLISKNLRELFVCAFVGICSMFLGEIFVFSNIFSLLDRLNCYIGGLYGSFLQS